MRSSPSGRQIPNEIIRYSFPLVTGDAGLIVCPLWSSPGASPVDTAGAGLLSTPFTSLPGRLDLASVTVISGGGNTGDPISLQWQATTTILPVPTGAPVADFIDPTAVAGVVTRQLDFKDIIVPDTGAALAPFLTIPANLVVNSLLRILFSVSVLWKESAIRNPLG